MTELRRRLSRSLESRYAIEDEIGRGGMATVFKALDRKHERHVALKVLHPELAAELAADRFLVEIHTAAGLQHPHIVPLYDSGHVDGLLYFVMPYVKGDTLRRRLRRDGPLPVADVIRIGSEVADALDYAHRSGIVHRDIKPENILLSGRHALVTDFGIATAVTRAGSEKLTETGVVIGTPAYMSPEQAEATGVDGRADIYSLGCVLYEMLTGRRPYDGPTAVAIIARRLSGSLTPLRDLRPDVPPGLEKLVLQALASKASDRVASAAELGDRLRTGVAARFDSEAVRRIPTGPSIAVLPFKNVGMDPENEYFSDGMAEELINALTKLPSLKVAARTSSFAFKGQGVDLRSLGETLGVSTVLEGSVRQSGSKLRVTAQLIDVKDGFHIWSDRYDREMTDVFAIQDEIAAAIVEQLKVRLTPDQAAAPLVRWGTENLDAYHLYHKGRYFWERRALQKALESFEQAATKDPNYALPLTGLADGYSFLAYYGFVPALPASERASEAARRAVVADETLAEAHVSRAGVVWFFQYDAVAAEAAFRRAASLAPMSAHVHSTAAYFYGTLHRIEDLRSHGRLAVELDVLSPHVARLVGLGHALAGLHDEGIEFCQDAVRLDPTSAAAAYGLGVAFTEKGLYEEAIDALNRALQLAEASPLYVMTLGYAYGRAGREAEARGVIRKLEEQSMQPYCAWLYATLGDMDEAFRSLEAVFEQRNPIGIYFAHWPHWAELREDPRFTAIVRNAGLGHLVVAG